jgi:nuclear mRNA export protein PCID2/THP1
LFWYRILVFVVNCPRVPQFFWSFLNISKYRHGTYLLLERCKAVCYRSLFQKIYRIFNKPYISLEAVVDAFKWLTIDVDIDEVECILANLIFRGIIRGYIAHTKKMLVLSKSNPFPIESLVR